ncbi:MAG: thiamine pyrophosphate-dependent dehydrogenase E1 component subunit alpha [Sedimenticola sp.]
MNTQSKNDDIIYSLHRQMLRIRVLEETLASRYAEWKMRCPMHLCIGQEAIAVGVAAALDKSDVFFSNHRSHGHYLAKGGDMKSLVAELYGKRTGCAGGRGGSMHLIDIDNGFLGSTPIVGGTVPLAVGHAWAAKLNAQKSVTVVFFGDGCFEEGVLHESMNFASLHKLPVLFICENNGYSVYTSLKERQPDRAIMEIARAHGLTGWSGNGNSVQSVYDVACKAEQLARNGNGPQFLELFTHRWREHCGPEDDDDLEYREEGELQYWMGQDPIKETSDLLMDDHGLDSSRLDLMLKEIEEEVADAFMFAEQSAAPGAETLENGVYKATDD